MNFDQHLALAIGGMALATYSTRLAGYWLLRGVEIKGRLKAALDAVPPAIITAVIAPMVFLHGVPEMLAGALALMAALLRAPLLLTIGIGVGSVALLRLLM